MNLKRLQKTIEKIGTGLKPDEDWVPTLLLEDKKKFSIFGMAVPMHNQEDKDRVAECITKMIFELRPDSACWVTTAWTIDPGEFSKLSELDKQMVIDAGLSKHPMRIEVVNAYCYGERGENEGEAFVMGYIRRFPDKHPEITKWRSDIGKPGTEYKGRFPEAMHEGFRLARKRGNKYGTNKTKSDER